MDAAPRQLPVFEDVCGKLSNDELFDAIARNACDYQSSYPLPLEGTGGGSIQMLGHSMNAVSIPKGGELVYEFYSPLLSEGQHTLKIKALDDHIIMDQWMLDFKKDRKFYVIPVK